MAESDDYVNPLARYSDDAVARAVRDPETVRQLLAQGSPVTANALFAAIEQRNLETLRLLLESGADPNLRGYTNDSAQVENAQYLESSETDFDFERESSGWYPIEYVAHQNSHDQESRNRQAAMMTLLLDHGANLRASHRQRLAQSSISLYPGGTVDRLPVPATQGSEESPAYGLRSVFHGLLEDGAYVHPILDHPGTSQVRDHLDNTGRSLFLAACRSSIGADAAVDAMVGDAAVWRQAGSLIQNPLAATDARPSLFDWFRDHGADLTASDGFGKSAIHNLLNSHDSYNHSYRPTGIRKALLYMISNFPSLVNQPDHRGDYPLHAAFQRLRRYPLRWEWDENAELDTVIEDMLEAGADPLSRDSQGNTALHYLADEGLAETIMGEQARRRFKLFLERGIDVNARNKAGYSALELLIDDDGDRHFRRKREYFVLLKEGNLPVLSAEEVDKEVFGMFDEAAVKWTELGLGGRTLLHAIAAHQNNPRGAEWTKLLLARGVDPSAKDNEGKTAREVAEAHDNGRVATVLASVG